MCSLVSRIASNMKSIRVYKGVGVHEQDTDILLRVLNKYVDDKLYRVECITTEDIVQGQLSQDTALLAIGGGYDMGLIKSLGEQGMNNIKTYVQSGGSYLGICSGAYFACGRIEFDKDGPLEVVGERYLKFFPGCGKGPLFKPYDYASRKGALAVDIDFIPPKQTNTGSGSDGDKIIKQNSFHCKSYFNGGLYFDKEDGINMNNVTVLSQYLSLPGRPAAMVQCRFGSGMAVLIGPHVEYESSDIDDGDIDVVDIIPCLNASSPLRSHIMMCVLNSLNIVIKTPQLTKL